MRHKNLPGHVYEQAALLLNDAKTRIAEGWTQFYLATDQLKRPVPIDHPFAQSYCLSGSMHAAEKANCEKYKHDAFVLAWDTLYDATMGAISEWNDAPSRTKEDVLNLLTDRINFLRNEASRAI